MKGLAFKPPYGLALFHGKNIENRSKGVRWDYEGWLCVYHSKTPDRAYYDAAIPVCRANGYEPPPYDEIARGAIIGVVWMGKRSWGDKDKGWGFADHWWYPVSQQYLFEEPISFKAKFMLGLFEVPDDLVALEMVKAGIEAGRSQQLNLI
jgi:hypothetical protein